MERKRSVTVKESPVTLLGDEITVGQKAPGSVALKRFCQAFDINRVKTLSDHRTADFGHGHAVLIKDLRLLSRAIFVMSGDGTVSCVEHVSETGNHPDYEGALTALKNVAAE